MLLRSASAKYLALALRGEAGAEEFSRERPSKLVAAESHPKVVALPPPGIPLDPWTTRVAPRPPPGRRSSVLAGDGLRGVLSSSEEFPEKSGSSSAAWPPTSGCQAPSSGSEAGSALSHCGRKSAGTALNGPAANDNPSRSADSEAEREAERDADMMEERRSGTGPKAQEV